MTQQQFEDIVTLAESKHLSVIGDASFCYVSTPKSCQTIYSGFSYARAKHAINGEPTFEQSVGHKLDNTITFHE